MKSLTFNPGPSKLSPLTYEDIERAVTEGFLECSHRSSTFYAVSSGALEGLREYLGIPKDYHVFFVDSATNSWHSIAANVVREESFHIVQGAFSKKAYGAAEKLYKHAGIAEVPQGQQHDFATIEVPETAELITCCFNESSSGTIMTVDDLRLLRERCPQPMLAVDITSSAAMIDVPIEAADIWYFSVQKGFGLPAGLGILIISPRAFMRSQELEASTDNLAGIWRWSEFVKAQENQTGQTINTPNMLDIFLLNRSLYRLLRMDGIERVQEDTYAKAERIFTMIEQNNALEFFVEDAVHRSPTVITIKATVEVIATLHKKATEQDIVLGNGYGDLKDTTIRIANFPAITFEDIDALETVLQA